METFKYAKRDDGTVGIVPVPKPRRYQVSGIDGVLPIVTRNAAEALNTFHHYGDSIRVPLDCIRSSEASPKGAVWEAPNGVKLEVLA